MYSQNNEEKVVLDYFKGQGRLLDIGAYDGRTFSNSLALLERGWHGVLVEASPSVFVKLMANTKGLSVELVNACIVPNEPGLVTFHNNDGAVATMNETNLAKWAAKEKFQSITVMTCDADRLLDKVGTNFDMVNIDVEGGSVDLLESLIPRMPEVQMWIVEHDGMTTRCSELLKGYELKLINAENVIYVKPKATLQGGLMTNNNTDSTLQRYPHITP